MEKIEAQVGYNPSTTTHINIGAIIAMTPLLDKPTAAKIVVGSVWVIERLKMAIPAARTGENTTFGIPIVIDPAVGYFMLEVRDQFDQLMMRALVS